jgi:outer membrane protein
MKRLLTLFPMLFLLLPTSGRALTLDEGLKIVTDQGRDVAVARSNEETAQANVSLARSPWLPSVNAYASNTQLDHQPTAKFGAATVPMSQEHFVTYGVRATQLVYDFGKTSSSINAAKHVLDSQRIETERTRNQAALEFTIAYLDVLEADKLLLVSQEEVQQYEAHRKDTESRFRAGVITKNEVLQAEVTLVDSRQRFVTAENLRSLRASRVNSMLLRSLNDELREDEVVVSPTAGISLERAWTEAESGSDELKELDARIAAQEENVRSVQADYLPTFYVAGGYEHTDNRYQVYEDNTSLIAGVNINLFAGGATNARAQAARSELRTSKLQRDRLLDAVRLSVKAAYLDIVSSTQKLDVTKTATEQAKENLRLQQLRYKEGVATATEVLDAVTLLTNAESNTWKAQYGLKRAEANLLYAMGRELPGQYRH